MAGTLCKVRVSNFTSLRYVRINKSFPFKEAARLANTSPIYSLQEKSSPNNNYLKQKIANLMKWYEEVTGMDEVRLAQNRVLDAEQNFIAAQERRREANKEVAGIQTKLKELYSELDTTSRGEERYVQIITQEHRVLKEEKRLLEDFQRYEREERDYFSSLSTAVKDSHEKERAQAEKTKYWSIIGSIIGTVLGIAGSSINNEIKMKQLRKLVQDSLMSKDNGLLNTVPEALTKHEKELSILISQMKTSTTQPNDQIILGRLDELLHNLDNKLTEIPVDSTSNQLMFNTLKTQQENTSKQLNELKELLKSQQSVQQLDSDQIVVMPIGLEDRINKQNKNMQILVVISTGFAVVLPLVFKFVGWM